MEKLEEMEEYGIKINMGKEKVMRIKNSEEMVVMASEEKIHVKKFANVTNK